MCPVLMHIPVRLLRLFVSILSVFLWCLPSMRSVCACLLEFHLVCEWLLTLSFIMFLMWLSGTRLHTKLLLTVPALASSSAFSLPQCPVWAFIHLSFTVFSSASLVSAFWQSVMDLLLCILLERACSADRLSLQKVICWFLKVISSSAKSLRLKQQQIFWQRQSGDRKVEKVSR